MDPTRHQPFRLTSKLPIGHDQYWNLIANPNRGAVLFGDLGGSSVTHFFHDCHSLTSIHQKIRRDYPLEGDCALAFWQEKKPHETRSNCEDLEVHTLKAANQKRTSLFVYEVTEHITSKYHGLIGKRLSHLSRSVGTLSINNALHLSSLKGSQMFLFAKGLKTLSKFIFVKPWVRPYPYCFLYDAVLR